MRLNRFPSVALALAALALGACTHGNILGKNLPDETQVIDGPSLALPPNYQLRPPREAEDYEAVLRAQTSAKARSLITGVSTTQPQAAAGSVPEGEAWLVKKAAAQSGVTADPNVRSELDAAADTEAQTKDSDVEKAKKGLLKRWFGNDEDE